MDEHDDLIRRLRELGRQPIEPELHAAHLAAMRRQPVPLLRSKMRVAAAFLAGLLVGGSGLAAAGALPDPAQNVAHNVLEQIGVQVPQPERYHAPECGPEAKRNHGQYVRGDRSLAGTDCGKPLAGAGAGADDEEGSGERGPKAPGERGSKSKADRGPCAGQPPWATDKAMSPEQKAAAQTEREAACPDDDVAGDPDAARAPADATAPTEQTTTTTEPTTTTSQVTSTTVDTTTTTTAG